MLHLARRASFGRDRRLASESLIAHGRQNVIGDLADRKYLALMVHVAYVSGEHAHSGAFYDLGNADEVRCIDRSHATEQREAFTELRHDRFASDVSTV